MYRVYLTNPNKERSTIVTARKISMGAKEALALLVQWKQSQPLDT